jgi:hypothetical protein
MTGEILTAILAERVTGRKACPDRFIKSGRSSIPRNLFRPLTRLEDAFLLLGRVASHYTLTSVRGLFTAEVRVGVQLGKATGEPQARTITLAIAQALEIEVPQ